MKHWFLSLALIWIGAANAQMPVASDANNAQNPCGPLRNPAYGPFDYRVALPDQKSMVERIHFTPGVEMLQTRTTGPFGGDIGYTLRAFPNHVRALASMQRLAEKEKRNPPEGAPYTVECFYERALRFQPNDYGVRLLYANFLVGKGGIEEAERHLAYVAETQADNPFAIYNIGLIYFDMKNYEQALAYAHKAMSMGLLRTELKTRLEHVNKWVEATPETPGNPASASAAASAASGAQ